MLPKPTPPAPPVAVPMSNSFIPAPQQKKAQIIKKMQAPMAASVKGIATTSPSMNYRPARLPRLSQSLRKP